MNIQEKAIARILFQNKINKANGQKFEDIFTSIMNYAEQGFQQIKPWGNIGDRKNDGYIKSKGVYFQVFAPEEIGKSYIDIRNLSASLTSGGLHYYFSRKRDAVYGCNRWKRQRTACFPSSITQHASCCKILFSLV